MTFDEFQQQSVSDTCYPNQGKGSTLGMSMCLAGINNSIGGLASNFISLVKNSELEFITLAARQNFLANSKQFTVEALHQLLCYAACYANEWGLNLEDITTGAAAQPSTVVEAALLTTTLE